MPASDDHQFVLARLSNDSELNSLSDKAVSINWTPLALQASGELISRITELVFELSQWLEEANLDGARVSQLSPTMIASVTDGSLPPDPLEDILDAFCEPFAEFTLRTRKLREDAQFWMLLGEICDDVGGSIEQEYDKVCNKFAPLMILRSQLQSSNNASVEDLGRVRKESRAALRFAAKSIKRLCESLRRTVTVLNEVRGDLFRVMESPDGSSAPLDDDIGSSDDHSVSSD